MDYYDTYNSHYDNDYYYSQYQSQRFERMIDDFLEEERMSINAMYSMN